MIVLVLTSNVAEWAGNGHPRANPAFSGTSATAVIESTVVPESALLDWLLMIEYSSGRDSVAPFFRVILDPPKHSADDPSTQRPRPVNVAARRRRVPTEPPSKPLALIVDRDPEVRRFAAGALQRECRVELATGVKDAVREVCLLRPDIIVCALSMLRTRGHELVRRLRAEPAFRSTPILILASRDQVSARLQQIRGLVQDYVVLPCLPGEVEARARNLLETQRRESELRTLSARLLTAQEDERKRIARELHDDLSQRLGALSMDLSSLESRPPESQIEIQQRIRDIGVGVDRLAQEVHELSRGLHPAILRAAGLEAAIRSECSRFAGREKIAVDFRANDLPEVIPEDVSLCVYRVFQECLRNIAKHARTDAADVTLNGRDGGIRLTVGDNGVGFPPRRASRGLGLTSMLERVRLLDGTLQVDSAPGRGTTVCLFVPIGKEKNSVTS